MANMNDYLLWRGDVKITKEYPFNEIDSMLMARFSYLCLNKINLKEKETILSISEKMKDYTLDYFLNPSDKELITNLGKSTRFNNMIVTDYVKNTDREIEKQFGAVTIHLSKEEMYVSYVGTDSTINGWKEDFNMAYMDDVPCQVSGREYLSQVAKKYPRKKIRVGGHSKGGNVAIYSFITSPNAIKKRIIKVYNYDGPGFSKNIIAKYASDETISKIETYIPQESVIGRTLNHKEKITTVLSKKGLLGHDIYSWEVLKDDIIKSKITYISENIDETITNWLANTTNEQRKIFFDTIFELFNSTDAETFSEMSRNITSSVPKILKKYGEISPEDKKVITEMIKKIITSNMNALKRQSTIKLDSLKNEYIAKGKEKIEELDEKYFSNFK